MTNKPKGTQDILPDQAGKWQYISDVFADTARVYGFREIRTPIFEYTELFSRSAGEGSDIVNKEMYTFTDKGGRSLTLKPEGTAGVARAFIENGLSNIPLPVKLWYNTPLFRYERPQAGRFRQHCQLGCELFGSSLPEADFEVVSLAHAFLQRLGAEGIKLFINSIGCPSCRAKYLDALREFYQKNTDKLCPTCHSRLEKNTLRVLDCKEESCGAVNKSAPVITDFLCSPCRQHFEALQKLLTAANIEFEIDPRLVRGLDYYSGTVFEFVSEAIGAKSTVCGGGRYDGLIEQLGGKPMPAAGFGMGIERLLLLLEKNAKIREDKPDTDVYFAVMGSAARSAAMGFVEKLRRECIAAETDLTDRSLKAQLKYADSLDAVYTVIIGEDELSKGCATVKNMFEQTQENIPFEALLDYLKDSIG